LPKPSKKGIWLQAERIPELRHDMTESDKRAYRDKTSISADKALKINDTARSHSAIRMEVNGKPWGVLVLDSVNPKMPESLYLNRLFRLLTSAIAAILEVI